MNRPPSLPQAMAIPLADDTATNVTTDSGPAGETVDLAAGDETAECTQKDFECVDGTTYCLQGVSALALLAGGKSDGSAGNRRAALPLLCQPGRRVVLPCRQGVTCKWSSAAPVAVASNSSPATCPASQEIIDCPDGEILILDAVGAANLGC